MTWRTSETFIQWKVVVAEAVVVAAAEVEEVVMEPAANGSASTMATTMRDMVAMMTDMDMVDTMMGMVEDTIHPIGEEDSGEVVAAEVADEEEAEAEVTRKELLLVVKEVKRKLLEVATPTLKVAPVSMLLDILHLWSKHPMVDEAVDAAFIEEVVVVAEVVGLIVVGLMLSA
jgi:hypothetical protein